MTDHTPTPGDDLINDASALYGKALEASDRALKSSQDRVARAAGLLEAQASGFLGAVIPALVLVSVVILIGTKDRYAPAVILVMVFGVFTAVVLYGLLGGFAALLRVQVTQAEALGRIAAALEGRQREEVATPAAVLLPAPNTAEIARQAIRGRHWDDASALVHAFADAHPDHPEARRLADELAGSRRVAKEELLAKIEAARGVNEPERVIDLRDELKPLIEADDLRTLDRDLAKWFLLLLHRRLRSGTVGPDVAVLAGRVAASLDQTPEGASLRASLPTLRRAAGLCARCARPYKGIADACPACLSGAPAPVPEPDEIEGEVEALDPTDPGPLE